MHVVLMSEHAAPINAPCAAWPNLPSHPARQMNRRHFLLMAGGATASLLTGCTPSLSTMSAGCYRASYSGLGASSLGCGLLNSFGDSTLDLKHTQEVAIQSSFWQGIPAQVYVFDECQGIRNALALPEKVILFGINLAYNTIATTGSDLPLAGILAHEWGHQIQFALGFMDPYASTARSSELEADAFSGYYMGLAKGWAMWQMSSYFQLLSDLGDFQFNSPGHHGTPDERRAAGTLGMQVAANVIQSGVPLSYYDLHPTFIGAIGKAILRQEDWREADVSTASKRLLDAIDLELVAAIAEGRNAPEVFDMPVATESYRLSLAPFAG